MDKFAEFTSTIEEFIQLFEELIPIEQKKLDAAIANKVLLVEECMNKEQAAVLKMRGLEQKREQVQKEMDMDGYTFKQILEKVPAVSADTLQPLFRQLSGQITTFQSISESAKEMIELNLHRIQSSLSNDAKTESVYSQGGNVKKGAPVHFTSRSV